MTHQAAIMLCDDDLDHVIGIIDVKDVSNALANGTVMESEPTRVKRILLKIVNHDVDELRKKTDIQES